MVMVRAANDSDAADFRATMVATTVVSLQLVSRLHCEDLRSCCNPVPSSAPSMSHEVIA